MFAITLCQIVTLHSGAVVSTDITIGEEVGICSTDLPWSCAEPEPPAAAQHSASSQPVLGSLGEFDYSIRTETPVSSERL